MRRILWNIYAWPVTLLLLAAYGDSIHQLRPLKLLDVAISIPSLIALHFHIWNKKIGLPIFWKCYTCFFILWELAFNAVLDPLTRGEKFDLKVMIVAVILIPLYVGNFRYAFTEWTDNEHNQKDAPDQEPVR